MPMLDPQLERGAWRVVVVSRLPGMRKRLRVLLEQNGLQVVDHERLLQDFPNNINRTVADVLLVDLNESGAPDDDTPDLELILDNAQLPVMLHDSAETKADETVSGKAWVRRLCQKLSEAAHDWVDENPLASKHAPVKESLGGDRDTQLDDLLSVEASSSAPAEQISEMNLHEQIPSTEAELEPEEKKVSLPTAGDEQLVDAELPVDSSDWEGKSLPDEQVSESQQSNDQTISATSDVSTQQAFEMTLEQTQLELDAVSESLEADEDDTGVFHYSEDDWEKLNQTGPIELNVAAAKVWVLGSSIGGPQALKRFLAKIPADLPMAFVIAQHIGAPFVSLLAEQLDRICPMNVRCAEEGFVIRNGELLIAPVGKRLVFDEHGRVEFRPESSRTVYSPSIDSVMIEVAKYYGKNSGAVLFSGMGNDGVEGCQAIAIKGGSVWTQDFESCVVNSMVVCAYETGVVSLVAEPERLADQLVKYIADGKIDVDKSGG